MCCVTILFANVQLARNSKVRCTVLMVLVELVVSCFHRSHRLHRCFEQTNVNMALDGCGLVCKYVLFIFNLIFAVSPNNTSLTVSVTRYLCLLWINEYVVRSCRMSGGSAQIFVSSDRRFPQKRFRFCGTQLVDGLQLFYLSVTVYDVTNVSFVCVVKRHKNPRYTVFCSHPFLFCRILPRTLVDCSSEKAFVHVYLAVGLTGSFCFPSRAQEVSNWTRPRTRKSDL